MSLTISSQEDDGSKAARISDWFSRAGITCDGVELFSDAEAYGNDAYGLRAIDEIPEGRVIATIPKNKVISSKTSSLGPFLEDNKLGGGLGLVFAVMHEAALGEKSKWHGYLSSLPPREYVPMFWDKEEEALLQGTDAALKPEQDRADTAADYEDEIVPLLDKGSHLFDKSKMTLSNFRAAASWVASRAFGVDDYHGMGMVPFADMFNHKASIINLSGDYQLEGACLEDHRHEEGSEDEGSPEDIEDVEGSAENSDADESVDLEETSSGRSEADPSGRPMLSYTSRGSMLDASAYPDQDLRPHICIIGTEMNGQQVLEIVAACSLSKGEEIFNTFGELENTELVCKYGFALPNNPFNSVHLSKAVLLEEAEALIGKKQLMRRHIYLEEQSHLLEEDEEPFLVLPKAHVGPSLMIAARILSCSQQEFSEIESFDLSEALHKWSSTERDSIEGLQPASKKPRHSAPNDGMQQQDADNKVASAETTDPLEGEEDQIIEADDSELSDLAVVPKTAWFPETLCKLLQSCIKLRLKQYQNADIEDDRTGLAAAKLQRPRLEKHSAKIAAFTLIVDEKELLMQTLQALDVEDAFKP